MTQKQRWEKTTPEERKKATANALKALHSKTPEELFEIRSRAGKNNHTKFNSERGRLAQKKRVYAQRFCSVKGCDNKHRSLGLCNLHYIRERKLNKKGTL
jgi:hypothetical protein